MFVIHSTALRPIAAILPILELAFAAVTTRPLSTLSHRYNNSFKSITINCYDNTFKTTTTLLNVVPLLGLNDLIIIELIPNLQLGHRDRTEKACSQVTKLIKSCNQVTAVNTFNLDGKLMWYVMHDT